MIATWRSLRKAGVTGINARNAQYVLRYNARRYYPLVDDKLQTKRLAQEAGMAVPELYAVIETEHDIRLLDACAEKHEKFVIKPAHGSGGNGVLVIAGRSRRGFRKASGDRVTGEWVRHHVSNTLNGMYSLGGHPDSAMVEYCVEFDPVFEEIAYKGVPDVRIIVFQGYPVMAMVRLPTHQSDGKANLHQGAIGVGVDIATGTTLEGTWLNEIIREHPDTERPISGIRIPHWDTILEFAARCCDLTNLGYVGVDIVLDKKHGPLILELNARPGLSIQIANRQGLTTRLQIIEARPPGAPLEERLAFVRREFAAQKKDQIPL